MRAATGRYTIQYASLGRRSSDCRRLEFDGWLLGMADARIECTQLKDGVLVPATLFTTVRVYLTNDGEVISTASYGISSSDARDISRCSENPKQVGRHRSLTAAIDWLADVQRSQGGSPLGAAMRLVNRQVAATLPPVCGMGDATGG
jgi:hypothetical protein